MSRDDDGQSRVPAYAGTAALNPGKPLKIKVEWNMNDGGPAAGSRRNKSPREFEPRHNPA
ncbi:MAG: hypothetical protein E6431_35265 [Bradyrhizobium sp.]|uniref:hypothetical protein n=1 Tax=Bradyrhizobium sp. TaxID=376 RepID=UPI001B89E6E2|nr:hypothetical protein [Bradyrhizobium sp.]MDU1695887.1 hypothetical protein [Bradyrhizobium sp.]MDU6325093.1 hypothetical protein [Bradyrhizobium sp.]MDU6400128.1 hypothetical protein [Bradyrhizobium sp.]MDU6804104.1 hypothetical protein [Bradyrhizobium sp.]